MLSRDTFLAFKDDRIGRFEVPELGGEVGLARLTVADNDKIAKLSPEAKINVEVMILGCCDEDGKRIFTAKDRDALDKLPADVAKAVAQAVFEHNGFTGETKNDSGETEN